MGTNDEHEIASKYQVELNSKYSNYSKQVAKNKNQVENEASNIIKENKNQKESG